MLLPSSIRVAEWERAVQSINCTCLSWALVNFSVCSSFPFGIEGGMWDVIVLIPDHCLSTYFTYVWAWWSCSSSDLDRLKKHLFPPPQEALHEIWL